MFRRGGSADRTLTPHAATTTRASPVCGPNSDPPTRIAGIQVLLNCPSRPARLAAAPRQQRGRHGSTVTPAHRLGSTDSAGRDSSLLQRARRPRCGSAGPARRRRCAVEATTPRRTDKHVNPATRIRRLGSSGSSDSDPEARIRRLGSGDSDPATRIRRIGSSGSSDSDPATPRPAKPSNPRSQ